MGTAVAEKQLGLDVRGARKLGYDEVLTPDALAFVAELVGVFGKRLQSLLARRREVQQSYTSGSRHPDFLVETAAIREGSWRVAPLPEDLLDRRVEITGPTDRKMIINALNSGANVFMADLEDSTAPSWDNVVQGQINLRDAVRGTIAFRDVSRDKVYRLDAHTATLFVRPRGLHLVEQHVLFEGAPIPAALFDFGLYFYHNVEALLEHGTGPYFYLPKLESHLEAQWWNDVFLHAQHAMGIGRGTIKATVLIETLPGAFQMDEILYALREHSAGLNCGRWDYIFSYIKTLRGDAARVVPDREQVTMTQPFMRAYTQWVIRTCHRRGVHAMGGMAAQIPNKSDPVANAQAFEKVRADKLREVTDGHDGTWVAHPGLVPVAREIFDAHMPGPNQINTRLREDVRITAADLLATPEGTRTLSGLRRNIRVGVQYLAAWLQGQGCVPLYGMMEDAATAEICRVQIWQWLQHGVTVLDDHGAQHSVDMAHVLAWIDQEVTALCDAMPTMSETDRQRLQRAKTLFTDVATHVPMHDFLTIPAYKQLISIETPVAVL